MTSRTSQQTAQFISYQRDHSDDFCYPEPEHKPDSMEQGPTIHECAYLLMDYFSSRPDVLVDAGGEIYYDRNDRIRGKVSPDIYVSFGVDAAAIFSRDAYLIWEAGKPPDFALEVASRNTYGRDTDYKPGLYAAIGVGEYWRFDPSGGNYHGCELSGEVLSEGVYHPVEIGETPDGVLQGYSPALGLLVCVQARRLFFRNPLTGQNLASIREERIARVAERDARLAAEEEAEQERAARIEERAARMEERAARRAAEAEVERLRDELRRLQGQ